MHKVQIFPERIGQVNRTGTISDAACFALRVAQSVAPVSAESIFKLFHRRKISQNIAKRLDISMLSFWIKKRTV